MPPVPSAVLLITDCTSDCGWRCRIRVSQYLEYSTLALSEALSLFDSEGDRLSDIDSDLLRLALLDTLSDRLLLRDALAIDLDRLRDIDMLRECVCHTEPDMLSDRLWEAIMLSEWLRDWLRTSLIEADVLSLWLLDSDLDIDHEARRLGYALADLKDTHVDMERD